MRARSWPLLPLLLSVSSILQAGVPVDHDAIRRDRLRVLLPQVMAAQGLDMWLTFTRESALDPLLPTLGVDSVVARAAFIFLRAPDGSVRNVAIAASYDVDPIRRSDLYDEVISYEREGIKPHLAALIGRAGPRRIAVNISRDEMVADGLTAGMRDYLEETLGRKYTKRFVSSERLVSSLLSRKLPAEIAALSEASAATQRIIAEAFTGRVIRPGFTSEKDLNDWMVARAKELGYGVAFSSIVTGPSRGHSEPTDRIIEHGDVIRVDWGATHEGYAADIQRTGYVLHPGQKAAPPWLTRMFADNLAAQHAAVAACRPGNRGVDVDRAGREVLVSRGYREPPHGSGHPIGLKVHDVGPKLSPDWPERYGAPVFFEIEPDQVFAIEPMIYAVPPVLGYEFHIGLEENVVVTPEGPFYFGQPQEELILIETLGPGSRS